MIISIISNYSNDEGLQDNLEEISDALRFYVLPLSDLFIGLSFLYFAYYQLNITKQ